MTGSSNSRRVVSLWLPDWPLNVHARNAAAPPEGAPFALVERGRHGMALSCINAAARAFGLRSGQRHADARAIVPGLATAQADPAADARALEHLARWCWRWTPSVGVDGSAGLFLDVTGAAHLWGGEAALLRDMLDRLSGFGVAARAAIADTPGAAWALARFGDTPLVLCPPGAASIHCAALPLAALRLDTALLETAAGLGLRCIGDLLAMPRAGLARRFRSSAGLELVERLDQLLGIAPEAIALLAPPPRYVARRAFAEPISDTEVLAGTVPVLMDALAAQLQADGQGALALRLVAFRSDGDTTEIAVRLSLASRQTGLWLRLFRERGFERLDLGFGVDALMIVAESFAPEAEAQHALLPAPVDSAPLLELCDRLQARLGTPVLVGEPRASWLPERAEAWPPLTDAPGSAGASDRVRPLLLLDPPEPIEAALFEVPDGVPVHFRWRQVVRRISRAEGPERLSPEWWRRSARPRRTRDYYRVEDDTGARYWLFREGLYGWEDGERPPTWWLHGLFA